MPLEPLPETREALLDLGRFADRDLTAELVRQGELVEDIVPNLLGLSLALVRDGLTFTIAATSERLSLLDAIQYTFGGPCVDAALQDEPVWSGDGEAGLLDEQRWAQFARASAAHGVLSTLSLPIHTDGRVVAGVNLYAATPNAFAGREERLGALLGAWAPGAVHNADLTFSSRHAAREAPRVLHDSSILDQATGVVISARGVAQGEARRIIADAARRAGQDELTVARELIRPYQGDDGPPAHEPGTDDR
jgi:GAF domain-containing protein